ncbi:DNA repair exonuclease [Roseobacter phage RDJL Phi 2]|uniref:Uncharacterized protein n=1 Tax=Roseobacter phage RDJL Phi 2 TaxID=1682380 RepID=A0A0K0PVN1_9CAUD|nr:DNA repair exonuclease [Roseobacter phage RDJL Phi 2]AKQ75794.1 hypothetical protein RDJLphi2_gp04 [Roseobacter phage RDJL Phi 2]
MSADNYPTKGRETSDADCLAALVAWKANGQRYAKAAKAMGLHRDTVSKRVKLALKRNIDKRYLDEVVPAGFEILRENHQLDKAGKIRFSSIRTKAQESRDFEMPPAWATEKSTVQVDGEGNLLQQWLRIKPEATEAMSVLEALGSLAPKLVGDFEAPNRDFDPEGIAQECLTLRPLPDLHLGMYAWGKETGQAWDLKTAMARFKDAMVEIDRYTPKSKVGIILGGGDLIHADNKNNQTDRSKNALDVDTRFSKVTEHAMKLLVFQVELSRRKHEQTVVRILPGNHDELFANAASWYLHAWYRNQDDVVIDVDPGDFWFYEWGKVMLGANHGHKVKLTELPRIMSTYEREMWGRTSFAYAHGFHIHHRTQYVFEEGGVVGETHQAPVPQDAYHHGAGYKSGRSLCSITYHQEKGESGRWTEPVF